MLALSPMYATLLDQRSGTLAVRALGIIRADVRPRIGPTQFANLGRIRPEVRRSWVRKRSTSAPVEFRPTLIKIGATSAESVKLGTDCAEIHPNLGHLRSKLSDVARWSTISLRSEGRANSRNAGRCVPNSSHLRPNPPKFGQSGRSRSRARQIRPNSVQRRPTSNSCGPNSAEFGPGCLNFGQNAAKLAPAGEAERQSPWKVDGATWPRSDPQADPQAY